MSNLNLQLRFPRLRPLRKNIQNQHRAIDDLAFQIRFQITNLRRGQLIIEYNEIRLLSFNQPTDFDNFTCTYIVRFNHLRQILC
ncbi:hypothetical protein D3C77_660740 [compost metagenome]